MNNIINGFITIAIVAVLFVFWGNTTEALESIGVPLGAFCSLGLVYGLGLLATFILSRFDNRGYNNFLNEYGTILTLLTMVILWIPILVVLNVFQV